MADDALLPWQYWSLVGRPDDEDPVHSSDAQYRHRGRILSALRGMEDRQSLPSGDDAYDADKSAVQARILDLARRTAEEHMWPERLSLDDHAWTLAVVSQMAQDNGLHNADMLLRESMAPSGDLAHRLAIRRVLAQDNPDDPQTWDNFIKAKEALDRARQWRKHK